MISLTCEILKKKKRPNITKQKQIMIQRTNRWVARGERGGERKEIGKGD